MTLIRRAAALVITVLVCLAMPCSGTAESFSPVWAEMTEGYAVRHEPIRAALSVQCEKIPQLPDALAAKLNAWLEGSSVLLESRIRDEGVTEEHVRVMFDGERVLDCWVRDESRQTFTVFDGERGYLTDPDVSAYGAAAGLDGLLVPNGRLSDFFLRGVLPHVYDFIELNGAATAMEENRIKLAPAGNSPYQTRYELTGELMNQLWPRILSLIKNGLSNTLSLDPGLCDVLCDPFSGTVFSSGVTILRLFDGQGMDMGIRVSGRCRPGDGGTRKMTLTAAFGTEGSVYINLNLPASKGSYSDQWILKAAGNDTGRGITLEGSGTRKDALGSISLDLDGQWTRESLESGGTEQITGGVTLKGKVYGVEKSWSLEGNLLLKYGYGDGNFVFSRSMAGAADMLLTVYLQLGMGTMDSMPECAGISDLRGLSPARVQAALEAEGTGLSSSLLRHLASLDYPEWALLAHAFRNDTWMDSQAVESNENSEYTVDGTETEWSVN